MHVLAFESDPEDPLSASTQLESSTKGNTTFRVSTSVLTLTSSSRIRVNYHRALRTLIAEAKYLDILNLKVPDALVNISLQEDKHIDLQHRLALIVKRFHATMSSLDAPTERLLSAHVRALAIVVQPGLGRLNWTSLGIRDYADRCSDALTKFESVLLPVQVRLALPCLVVFFFCLHCMHCIILSHRGICFRKLRATLKRR